MGTLLNRGLSLLICISYLVIAYFKGAGTDVLKIAAALLLPMGCTWFAEAFGGYIGMAHYQMIDTPTPAITHLCMRMVFTRWAPDFALHHHKWNIMI